MSRERSIHPSVSWWVPEESVLPWGEPLAGSLARAWGLPERVPPVGHGVFPSGLRPALSWFQFGDLFLCKTSRIHGWGGGISRVISQLTAKVMAWLCCRIKVITIKPLFTVDGCGKRQGAGSRRSNCPNWEPSLCTLETRLWDQLGLSIKNQTIRATLLSPI